MKIDLREIKSGDMNIRGRVLPCAVLSKQGADEMPAVFDVELTQEENRLAKEGIDQLNSEEVEK